MTNFEIISELLVEELEAFKNQAQRVERVTKTLKEVSIKADSTEIKRLLQEFLYNQNRLQELQQKQYKDIQKRLQEVRVIPNWLLVFGFIFFISLACIIGYLVYILIKAKVI